MDWHPWAGFTNCEDCVSVAQETLQNPRFAGTSSCHGGKPSGTRRKSSEVVILHRDEDDTISNDLFGTAADILNTARDIAYLIWIGGL
jgi:hypothetical protein